MIITTFVVSLTIVSAIVLYFAASLLGMKRSIFLLTPVAFAGCLTIAWTIHVIQSMPIHERPEGDVLYRSHITDGKTIHLWATEDGEEFPKTWIFPYNDEDAKGLEEGKKNHEGGIDVMVGTREVEGVAQMTIVGSPKADIESAGGLKPYERK